MGSRDRFTRYISSMTNQNKGAKIQILYVCDAAYLQNKMSRVRYWAIEELSKRTDVNLNIIGPGFSHFDANKSLQANILKFNIPFSVVIWYKPLNANYNFEKGVPMPFKTCLRYNEMWDEAWTRQEIDETNTDIIVCHHYNDYLKYKDLYKDDATKTFHYNPHCSNPGIFKPLNTKSEIDILISGVTKPKHYPLKYRLMNLVLKHKDGALRDFRIHVHKHPGYNGDTSFENVNQIDYNELINKSKLCVACTSRHKYRLGKYVEIPMAGSVVLGDLPFEDPQFKEFVVEVNQNMTDEEILEIIAKTLCDEKEMERRREIGIKWSQKHTVEQYVGRLLQMVQPRKIFIISDEIRDNHPEFKNEKWICDILKREFIAKFPLDTTKDVRKADVIWYLAPWNRRFLPRSFSRDEWSKFMKTKKVVFTQHHVDPDKMAQLESQFEFMREHGTHFHAICEITKKDIVKFFDPSKVSSQKFWINKDVFYPISTKAELREKHKFGKDAYLVGSFQKDTEGQTNEPKLSKGPDLFVNIVKDMHAMNPNVEVVLTGLRREYIMNELDKVGIKYHFFNMISLSEINELYNCLDLYVVSSRHEGGPRSIVESALTRTPIISTCVGIAPELMHPSALFDVKNWKSYQDAMPNTEYLNKSVQLLMSNEYLMEFKHFLLDC